MNYTRGLVILISFFVIILLGGLFLFFRFSGPPVENIQEDQIKENKLNEPIASFSFNLLEDNEINSNIQNGLLNWEEQKIGELQVNLKEVTSVEEYFIPLLFGCLEGVDDKPYYLVYKMDDGSYYPGGEGFIIPGETKSYKLGFYLFSSKEYVDEFLQYPNIWQDYPQVDYTQKGIDTKGKNSINVIFYSLENDRDRPHCFNIEESKFEKFGETTLS